MNAECEFIISLTGIDETFSQAIHARFSYLPEEIQWNRSFQDILSRNSEGRVVIDVSRFHLLK